MALSEVNTNIKMRMRNLTFTGYHYIRPRFRSSNFGQCLKGYYIRHTILGSLLCQDFIYSVVSNLFLNRLYRTANDFGHVAVEQASSKPSLKPCVRFRCLECNCSGQAHIGIQLITPFKRSGLLQKVRSTTRIDMSSARIKAAASDFQLWL